ncbi:tyrosine-type recombinase/integrase [Microbacterium algeriense]|uniref:Tyrosine-type recombinase/integrase n=1 Tax=Microbacterium algeriense TaxID=2615184 RepID=A0ABQ6VBB3_9MICO|nr:tyrosine-type recombinase/integrase [Microbacterium algeriense]
MWQSDPAGQPGVSGDDRSPEIRSAADFRASVKCWGTWTQPTEEAQWRPLRAKKAWLAEQRAAVSPKTKRPHSQSSIRTRYVAVAAVFKYAVQLRLINVDPCIPVRIPKVEHHELTFLSPEQVNAVVERLDAEPPDGLVVQFAAYTGLRAGELQGMRIRDVNLFARQPYVHVQRQAQYEPKRG